MLTTRSVVSTSTTLVNTMLRRSPPQGGWPLLHNPVYRTRGYGLAGIHGNIGILSVIRHYWIVHLPRRYDTVSKKNKYVDWDEIGSILEEPLKVNSRHADREFYNREHIKPTELKRRLAAKILYNRSQKKVSDLIRYIRFVQKARKEESS